MRGIRSAAAMLLLVLSGLVESPAQEASRVQGVDRTLTVRGDENYPPFEFLDEDGNPTGFNVELFRAVAEEMRLAYRIELGPWNEVRGQLEAGEIDLLTGMFASATRDRSVDFTTPHSIVSHTIFVRKDSAIRTQADLAGKEILVQEGDIVHDYLLENPISEMLIPVVDQRQALQLLNQGFHDAAFLAKLQGLYFLQQMNVGNVRTIEETLIPRRYCFAVEEGDDELRALLNEGLNILKIDGTYDEIYDRWFGVLERQNAWEQVTSALVMMGTVTALLVAVLGIWTWSLRRTVQRRTRHLDTEIRRRAAVELELRRNQQELERSLSEKTVLLAEVHHRVKNNLQIISSLLELQRGASTDRALHAVLTSSQSRIDSMALLHDQLYSAKQFASVNLRDYVDELVGYMYNLNHDTGRRIVIRSDVEPVQIDLERAVPLGLMISEVLTNSFKYAFPHLQNGTIEIRMFRGSDGWLVVILDDDGVGFSPKEASGGALGLFLIRSLVDQLRGTLKLTTEEGVRYEVRLPPSSGGA